MKPENGWRRWAELPAKDHDNFVSDVRASATLREFSVMAVSSGIAFGIIFGAANAYLGLQPGLTVSTSIPIAVMSIAAFRTIRGVGLHGTNPEANSALTVGSASSSVASGVNFTMPRAPRVGT